MKEEEIRARLTGTSPETLQRSLALSARLLAEERSRGARAESRSTTILAVAAILAAFAASFAPTLVGTRSTDWWVVVCLYFASIGFLLKGSVYALRSMRALSDYRVAPDLAFRLQAMPEIESLREEILWNIWEYYQHLPVATGRMFLADRAQRSVTASAGCFALTGLTWLILHGQSMCVPPAVPWGLGLLLLVLLVWLDRAMEKLGPLWTV